MHNAGLGLLLFLDTCLDIKHFLCLFFMLLVEVDPDLDKESQDYLEALEQVTSELEQCVNLCKSHVMIVTCFDIGVINDIQDGAQEVEI